MAFPDKMWKQEKDKSGNCTWKFSCIVVWGELVKLADEDSPDPHTVEWVEDLTKKHGTDIKKWHKVGCNSGFKPWKCGPSRVVEIHTPNGDWAAFAS